MGALGTQENVHLTGLLYGGDQEGGMRAGTENMPGIVGLGKEAELRRENFSKVTDHLRYLRNRFEAYMPVQLLSSIVRLNLELILALTYGKAIKPNLHL